MSTPERRPVGDPVRLRALAHPIRLDLMERLATDGPLTATEAGERIGQSSGSTSFHLRQLEQYGFVEPVPGVSGRRKPWRLAVRGISLFRDDGTIGADEGVDERELVRTGAAVSTMLLQRAVDDAGAWLEAAPDPEAAWTGVGEVASRVRALRPDQLRELVADVMAVVDRYDDVTEGEADPEARRVRIAFVSVPIPARGR